MCDQLPGSVADALRVVHAGLDYLAGPDAALLDPAALGGVLTSLGRAAGEVHRRPGRVPAPVRRGRRA